jgi:hypothetical protein
MQSETKNCQSCKKDFIIEPEDFNFYEKIKVPPPTFCPECRTVRRMVWRNERSLYKRICAKTGKDIITMFHPEADVVVYDHDAWWGDAWDSTEYGVEYDFSKNFFEQYKELIKHVPLANLGNQNSPGSPFGNHNVDCKDSYLIFASFNNDRVNYSYGAVGLKDSSDTYVCLNSSLSYEDIFCAGIYKTHFSYNSDESLDSYFIKSCINLNNCIGCVNLRNKKYCILNKEYSREEYIERQNDFDFGSYEFLNDFRNTYNEFILNFPTKYANILKCQDVTGDSIINAKNVKNCFDVYGGVEDSKYLIHVVDMKDSYDVYGGGATASLMYEGIDAGVQSSNQLFSVLTHSCFDTKYTYMCYGSKDLFGCVGLRNKQYCILNKQYTKEEYFEMVDKIKKHMNDMPYIDKKGRVFKYGEFFPSEISPFAYNETITQEYFTKTKKEIIDQGFLYREQIEKDYKVTLRSEDLPDHIKDVPASIVNDIISCPNNADEKTQCTKAFRIIQSELDFLKSNNIALPRYCPNCRHYKRLSQRNPFKLWKGVCQCAGSTSQNGKYKNTITHSHGDGPCLNEFETSYAPERPEIVYCEKCYQAEVY